MAAVLCPGVNYLILTQPDNPRAATVESLHTLAENFVESERIFAVANVSEALEKAETVTSADGRICVTGSLYLVGEVSAATYSASRAEA